MGFSIPHLGYVESVFKIHQIQDYDEYFLLLVLPTTPYSTRIPFQIGTTVIDRAIQKITPEELAETDTTWCQTHISMVVTTNAVSAADEFDASSIDSTLNTINPVTIPPFECRWVKGLRPGSQ